MWHVLVRKERDTGFWWEKPEGNSVLEGLGIDGMYLFYRNGLGGSGMDWSGSG
jgi:hypothetical protein